MTLIRLTTKRGCTTARAGFWPRRDPSTPYPLATSRLLRATSPLLAPLAT